MEREKEILKLVNVLRQTSRMALQSEWTGGGPSAASYCVDQYNRVLPRLREIDADLGGGFEPLRPGSSATVAAMACRQLAAYYQDEARSPRWPGDFGVSFDPETFRDFWQKSAKEFEDLGEFIRESIHEWTKHHKPKE